jgi:hypothetical protein
MFNFKQISLSLMGIAATGLWSPVFGIDMSSLDNLTNGTNPSLTTSDGLFQFSQFSISATGVSVDLSLWKAFVVSVTTSSDDPLISFTGTFSSGSPATLAAGDYEVIYRLAYIGTGNIGFFGYGQSLPCITIGDCDTAELNTTVYNNSNFIPANAIGTGLNDQALTEFSKDKGATPIFVKTTLTVDSEDVPNLGGTFDAQEVPWETDVLPLVGATLLFGGGMWWKRRRGASQLDLTGQGPEQEHK